jgi:D-hydroxyproline dehydrogenase subunit gamma
MFERSLEARGKIVAVTIDGVRVVAHEGDSVAAALLLADVGWTRRSNVTGAPRAPYCMMGVCFECLVTIDGIASEQACLVRVREGMRIERPRHVPEMSA